MNFWQGEKVRLRGIEPSDVAHFVEWNMDSERARHLSFVWPPVSASSVSEWVEAQSKKKLEDGAFHWVIENAAGTPVGTIRSQQCDAKNGTFTYSIDVAAPHRRNGYASEAIRRVLSYYFEEMRYQKVNVSVHSDNDASLALHRSIGFVQEGVQRRMFYTQGRFIDNILLGMTIDEFRSLPA